MRTRVRAVVAACCLAVLVGCSPGLGTAPESERSGEPSPELVARFGQAPAKDPSGLTYQPDVVVVGGGAAAVRSVSGDGLVWTVDADAPGLERLDVGEVMFLTSRAVGRVAVKQRRGGQVEVTLVPVQLHEVIRDGAVKLDVPIDAGDVDLGGVTVQEVPDLPGTVRTLAEADRDVRPAAATSAAEPVPARAGGGRTRFAAGVRHGQRLQAARPGELPPPARSKLRVTVGKWQLGTALDARGLTLSAFHAGGENFKFGGDITLRFTRLTLATDLALSGGRASYAGTSIRGIESLRVKVQAGVAEGVGDNAKVRLEVPVDMAPRQVVVGGVPMVVILKLKFFLETALTGRNSTLTAEGEWALDGPVGVAGNEPVAPRFSTTTPLIDSIGGIAIGPSGLVVGSEFRFVLGFGIPGVAAGPYVKLRASIGVTNGSALGAPLARCQRVDRVIKIGSGVGLNLDGELAELISQRIPGRPKVKADLETEVLFTVDKSSQVRPDVPLCTGG
ncbi:hypothetical protein GA0070606_0231 [Micromonospora citrea]|uniref:Uncharacterized protein n=1 Tax=Micromonospora citrea TaxID=47855 RepID=A0A1C6TRL2_9ACTN|nr:hypothetical protein [Micromonospora citrea]SCL44308.1 hypothetical protein GA0070606_0231 [Micromonospora citrea]